MAEPGFPWHAQPGGQEPTIISEKGVDAVQFEPPPSHSSPDSTHRSPSSSPTQTTKKHHHGFQWRRRSSAHKPPPISRSGTKSSEDIKSSLQASGPLPVRTIPPWVRDAEEDDLIESRKSSLTTPNAALVANHHHNPSTARRPLLAEDQHQEEGYPTSSGHIRAGRTSRWISFGRASVYPRENFNSEKVDHEWLDSNFTDYSKDWLADHNDDDVEDGSGRYHAFRRKQRAWYQRAQFTILRNPFIPLVFRLIVISFAIVAIGLGSSIYHLSNKITACIQAKERDAFCQGLLGGTKQADYYQDPSALMAIIVDVIAVAYSIYITYDEYFSKPLGLRPARAKVRLVLFDLFFIVFQAANLSLSFESLTLDEGACRSGDAPRTFPKFENVCDRAEALSSVLLISLIAWLMTFSVSVLRLVERINSG